MHAHAVHITIHSKPHYHVQNRYHATNLATLPKRAPELRRLNDAEVIPKQRQEDDLDVQEEEDEEVFIS